MDLAKRPLLGNLYADLARKFPAVILLMDLRWRVCQNSVTRDLIQRSVQRSCREMSSRVCTEISGLLVLVCLSLLDILAGFELSCFSGSESDVRHCGLWPERTRETSSWVLFPWAKFLCRVLVRDWPNLLQHSKMYKFHVFIASAKHMWWTPQWLQSTRRTTDVQQTPAAASTCAPWQRNYGVGGSCSWTRCASSWWQWCWW